MIVGPGFAAARRGLAGVYVIAFGLSAGGVFFNPAAASVLPGIVGERELVAGNSGLWTAAVAYQIALAPAGGALIAAWGVAPAFWLKSASSPSPPYICYEAIA